MNRLDNRIINFGRSVNMFDICGTVGLQFLHLLPTAMDGDVDRTLKSNQNGQKAKQLCLRAGYELTPETNQYLRNQRRVQNKTLFLLKI
jgi:hypothetical protein